MSHVESFFKSFTVEVEKFVDYQALLYDSAILPPNVKVKKFKPPRESGDYRNNSDAGFGELHPSNPSILHALDQLSDQEKWGDDLVESIRRRPGVVHASASTAVDLSTRAEQTEATGIDATSRTNNTTP